jgi:hypothetical protein
MSEDIEKKDDSIKLKIALLEAETKKHEQIELKIVHYFANGLYAREMHMPSGKLVTG